MRDWDANVYRVDVIVVRNAKEIGWITARDVGSDSKGYPDRDIFLNHKRLIKNKYLTNFLSKSLRDLLEIYYEQL